MDASAISPDFHANSVRSGRWRRRIEVRCVARANLLYGKESHCGLLNDSFDNRVPSQVPEAVTGLGRDSHSNASDQQSRVS